MNTQKVGYIRISSIDQNPARQLEGMELDRVFEDKLSGKDSKRPGLQEMLAYVRDGDEVIVHSLDRLARNLGDLIQIVKTLNGRGATIRFVNENLTFSPNQHDPMSTLLLQVFGAVAEFERALNRERQREGIALAKKAGRYKRALALDADTREAACRAVEDGVPVAEVARRNGISRMTLYKYLREYQGQPS